KHDRCNVTCVTTCAKFSWTGTANADRNIFRSLFATCYAKRVSSAIRSAENIANTPHQRSIAYAIEPRRATAGNGTDMTFRVRNTARRWPEPLAGHPRRYYA